MNAIGEIDLEALDAETLLSLATVIAKSKEKARVYLESTNGLPSALIVRFGAQVEKAPTPELMEFWEEEPPVSEGDQVKQESRATCSMCKGEFTPTLKNNGLPYKTCTPCREDVKAKKAALG